MIDEMDFRKSWSFFPTGVSVLAVKNQNDIIHGMTASSVMSISLDPPIIMVSVGIERSILKNLETSEFISVSLLSKDQSDIANYFSKAHSSDNDFFYHKKDVFYIKDSLCYFMCKKNNSIKIGDHFVYFLEVKKLEFKDKPPLVWYKGKFENSL
ncbi:MAG: hypothetical protein CL772_01040 [Chloroflexi bacterium]|nr:hypothetical protein [Chloroflexota bacterium]MBK89747.1 hypothetical protein [Chloroflexota bacterium]|tara:strand:+ start:27235 stop:27696 length:462 start_codon:yes stop_codon:yes gene_type:complete